MKKVAWSRGDWMQTFTGRRFYPLDPQADEIDPVDIAHALSLICRYGGHVKRFYSVAEHCVLLSLAVAPEHALWALLHDAAEAYVGDMIRPLKQQMPSYPPIEDEVLRVLAVRFGLRVWPGGIFPPAVKDADNRILIDERAQALTATSDSWGIDHLEPLDVTLAFLRPEEAEAVYTDRLAELWTAS